MREILFRGKSKGKPEWVYGSLYKEGSQAFILVGGRFYPEPSNGQSALGIMDWYEVFPDSIGQFTGLLDKHGRKIFEGDIVVTCPSPLSISDGGDVSKRLIVDSWVFTDMCYSAMCKKSRKVDKFYKIVGNIYDNPELLEAK